MVFVPGMQVGPYQILERLGQGGMATVYKAYHPALDRYVALKVLHPAFMEDPNFLERFRREARVVARLDHPNIVPIYDFSEHEGQPYLVMKFIEGETLKARLQRGRLSVEEIMVVAEAVGAALSYAHRQGVLHRDVKPSNVMLAADGRIYLTDFGLARIAQAGESSLSSDRLLGTPQYISPEQALGKGDLDERTDVYSFGVMLFELFLARVPYSADTPYAIIHDHIYTPLPRPRDLDPNISPALERVLLKALAKSPEDRFASVEALMEALRKAVRGEDALAGEPLPTQPAAATLPSLKPAKAATGTAAAPPAASAAPAAPPPSLGSSASTVAALPHRHGWWWFLGGILVAVLVVGAGVLVFLRTRPQRSHMPARATMPMLAAEMPTHEPSMQADEPEASEAPLSPEVRKLLLGIPRPALDAPEVASLIDRIEASPENYRAWFALAAELWSSGYPQWKILGHAVALARDKGDWETVMEAADEMGVRGATLPAARLQVEAYLLAPPGEWQKHQDDFYATLMAAAPEPDLPQYLPYDVIAKVSPELADLVYASHFYFSGEGKRGDRHAEALQQAGVPEAALALLKAERAFFIENDPAKARQLLDRILNQTDGVPEWVVLIAEADQEMLSDQH